MSVGATAGKGGFSGDGNAAFAAIVDAHWTPVYRFLLSLCGNSHDTEDLTQETFFRALRRLDSFRSGTKMRSWLLRIAANAFFDARRKQQRGAFQALDQEVPAKGPMPDHRLEIAEQCELLKLALNELSELTRMVFHLRAVEDLSFREIADLAETTEESARWHMHHARTKLLKRLSEKGV